MGSAGGNCETGVGDKSADARVVYKLVTRLRANLSHGTFRKSGVLHGLVARVVGGSGRHGGSGSAPATEKSRASDQPRRSGGALGARSHAEEFRRELARLHRGCDRRSSDVGGTRGRCHAGKGRVADGCASGGGG